MITKRIMGSCFFEYITEHDSEEKALNSEGIFKEVKLGKLRIERTKITKENDDSKSEDSTKTKGQRTEEV
jgi:hypothetical protein